jgi:phosphoribosyl 1,2-cyclic phosphate 1,2-diphosphodiesterase
MLKADLHIHSTISDGSCTMEEIINQAGISGLDVIAITDHDTCSHFDRLPKGDKVKVIAGIEISAIDLATKTKAHVLGFGIKEPARVEKLTKPLLDARHENCLKQIRKLKEAGYSIEEDSLSRADGKYIYKQHIMEYLVKTRQVADMFGDFYRSVFKNGGICDFDIEYINVFDAVRVIKEAGGKPVLAHPGQQRNFYLIPSLLNCGLDGIECNHSGNRPEDRDKIKRYAKEHNLFLTGGSDFHGTYEAGKVDLGEIISEESGVIAVCLD